MDTIFEAADIAIENGYNIIILSDKGVDKDKAPIPALLVAIRTSSSPYQKRYKNESIYRS